ncbi:hypothetical protein H257_00188 [Aphanomyces astaci]|uniref:Coiled-coil domain-containing protein 22 homolog n=1 Tax=Aphanomyces astaci TaxID=112090 RepID=W4HC12_APHAT|nr:hypothetical protein H257_00188 [Aphanomyces astaci]ETV88648.1 hypothetical protein H257_00188 [Aphanomyces astaci]|eukprot:XP_009821048.1 hypothetical protein H257_00188 [Aphanomyces astaci]
MDNSDDLISLTLKQSGWTGDVAPMASISAPELVELVTWGFAQIENAQEPLKFEFPKGVAQRHRLAASLAERLKALGYTHDCGYNHLLYPTEVDSRRMLQWIIQKLPKVEKEVIDVDTPRLQFRQSMHHALTQWATLQYTPSVHHHRPRHRTSMLPAEWLKPGRANPARRGYIASKQPLITDSTLCPLHKQRSLLELNALALAHDSSRDALLHLLHTSEHAPSVPTAAFESIVQAAFESASQPAHQQDAHHLPTEHRSRALDKPNGPTAIPILASTTSSLSSAASTPSVDAGITDAKEASVDTRTQDELQAMDMELIQLRERCAANEAAWHDLQAACEDQRNVNRQIEARSAVKMDDLRDVQQDVAIRHQTLDMLADASNNIAKLQDMCAKSSAHLMALAEEWESHRLPLVQELEAHAATQVHRVEQAKALEAETTLFQAETKALGETLVEKQAQRHLLERKYDAMAKGINRSMYTLRIMDIIKQVHKQKADIQKVVKDIRSVHKQINVSSEKLKRSEAIVEERLFQAAKDDKLRPEKKKLYIECYRLFTTIRELFDQLIACVAEAGKRDYQCRDLEIWISQMAHHVNLTNLDRIHQDMTQVKHENQALMHEIQAISMATP